MPLNKFEQALIAEVTQLTQSGVAKGAEKIVTRVKKPTGEKGPRICLEGYGDKEFLRMNSNSYLGMALREKVIAAEEAAAREYGVGPGAVRFISGSYDVHTRLEQTLAHFHGREACMITSSAYTSVMGVISTLTTPETIIISDELNHNCIINAMRLARPKDKKVYPHLDIATMEKQLEESVGKCDNVIVVTDGIFSMRGDMAPLKQMGEIVKKYNDQFPRDIVFVVDDSHGAGAFGKTGRGTEEYTGADKVDILIATLGKAFGVNGGYFVSSTSVINYMREKNPFYIYTNPITPSEAAASIKAIEILNSPEGLKLLEHLREMTKRFEKGITALGYETIPSEHPVVPLMVRDTQKTADMVKHLLDNGILATGLNFPVVPKGDQLIRFQIAADHTPFDIDYAIEVLESYKNR